MGGAHLRGRAMPCTVSLVVRPRYPMKVEASTRRLVSFAAFGFALATGCGIFSVFGEERPTDGEYCELDEGCSTGVCTTANVCGHSRCRCDDGLCSGEGEPDDACRAGWVCVEYDSIFAPVVDFFGGDPRVDDGYCQPLCEDGCPEHYSCGEDGRLCVVDTMWTYPEPAIVWSGPISGEVRGRGEVAEIEVEGGSVIHLRGEVSSPVGAEIVRRNWETVSGAGDYEDFEDVEELEVVVPMSSGYRRAEFRVGDSEHRGGMVTVIFWACRGAGEACGYQGSGCCAGCDDATDTCM